LIEDMKNSPWQASLIPHQPWPGGMGPEPPFFLILEAIIEKRRSAIVQQLQSFFEL